MATPDLVNVATINGILGAGAVTTSNQDIIDVPADLPIFIKSNFLSLNPMGIKFIFKCSPYNLYLYQKVGNFIAILWFFSFYLYP